MAHLSLPGAAGANVTVPLVAAQQVTDGGDFDIRMRMRLTDTDAAQRLLWTETINTNGFQVTLVDSASVIQAAFSGGGGRAVVNGAFATLGFAYATDLWLRLTWASATEDLDWYLSTTDTNDDTAVTWGASKLTSTVATARMVAHTKDPWYIGDGFGSAPVSGRLYRVVFLNETPTRVFDADFSDPTTWTYA